MVQNIGEIMNRRLLVAFGTIIAVFVIAIVGASSLTLTGSDSAPGEGTTNATCATNLVVKSVVDTSVPGSNTVNRVDITGDMTQCVGEQVRVEVELEGGGNVWAIYSVATPISSLSLNLNATTGDFYNAAPTATANVLQVNGTRVAPVPVVDFGVITVTIAKTWQ